MIHLYYFLRFAKNNLHLELGVGCFYSTSCREGKFSETLSTYVCSVVHEYSDRVTSGSNPK